MSQRNRIFTTAIALVAVLALAGPPPTHAAGLRPGSLPTIGAWDQVWSWLASFLPSGTAPQPADRPEKEGYSTILSGGQAGMAPMPTTTQGSMIDPDGRP